MKALSSKANVDFTIGAVGIGIIIMTMAFQSDELSRLNYNNSV